MTKEWYKEKGKKRQTVVDKIPLRKPKMEQS
jgi:hypothetical protein